MRISLRHIVRRAFHQGEPCVEELLSAARDFDCPISLSYVDKDRIFRNVGCHINSLSRRHVQLALNEPQPLADMGQGKCFIYFKLPVEALAKLRLPPEHELDGFLCKTILLPVEADDAGNVHEVTVNVPLKYIRRELRSHERYRVLAGMIAGASLWILRQAGKFDPDKPDFYYEPGVPSTMRIINISAGGARIALEQTDFIEDLATSHKTPLLLRLGLTMAPGQIVDTYIVCGCMSSHYLITYHRFTLRLRFLHSGNTYGFRQEGALATIERWLEKQLPETEQ